MADELADELAPPEVDSDFFAGADLVSVFVEESDELLESLELSLDELPVDGDEDDEPPEEPPDDPPVRLSFL